MLAVSFWFYHFRNIFWSLSPPFGSFNMIQIITLLIIDWFLFFLFYLWLLKSELPIDMRDYLWPYMWLKFSCNNLLGTDFKLCTSLDNVIEVYIFKVSYDFVTIADWVSDIVCFQLKWVWHGTQNIHVCWIYWSEAGNERNHHSYSWPELLFMLFAQDRGFTPWNSLYLESF